MSNATIASTPATAFASIISGPYAFVLLECLVIGLQCVLAGFPIGGRRRKYFNKAFFEKNFPELKGNYPQGGYPDVGCGRYSDKLTLAQWQDFNNAQRAHMNYVEGVATALVTFLVAGLFQPRLIAIVAAVYILGRFFYLVGYTTVGPKGRAVGAILLDLALVTGFGVGVYSAFLAGGGVKGLVDFATSTIANPISLWV